MGTYAKLWPEGYEAAIAWSDEDEVFVASFPAFPFVGAHGDTRKEATREARTAIRGVIEAVREAGKPLPPPNYRRAF